MLEVANLQALLGALIPIAHSAWVRMSQAMGSFWSFASFRQAMLALKIIGSGTASHILGGIHAYR